MSFWTVNAVLPSTELDQNFFAEDLKSDLSIYSLYLSKHCDLSIYLSDPGHTLTNELYLR